MSSDPLVTRRSPYDTDDAFGPRPFGQFAGVETIPRFTNAILVPHAFVHLVIQVVQLYAAFGGRNLGGARRDPDDANAVFRCGFGGLQQDGKQELREQEGRDVVGAQLLLVALFGLAPLGRDHDAGVVPQHV